MGLTGSMGPAGPPGAVLFLDGGYALTGTGSGTGRPTFAGITSFTTNGAPTGPGQQIGRLAMNARCGAEFAGSHICNEYEWAESSPDSAVSSPGAWIEFANTNHSRTAAGGCNGWTSGTSSGYGRVSATEAGGSAANTTAITCATVLPLACCRSSTTALFRGITSFTTNGAPVGPGQQLGRLSMNAHCAAEFPRSHICNEFEWAESTPNQAVPTNGAWIEFANTDGTRTTSGGCNSWTSGTSSGYGRISATEAGGSAANITAITCATVLPVACCE